MTGNELKQVINELRLSQAEFARLVGVTVGAVSQWLSEVRTIPGPVESFVGLFMRLPSTIREFELTQLQKGANIMRNGMYLIHFTGSNGDGYATLTFQDGIVYGFDSGFARYDGTCNVEANGMADIDVRVTMPPNVKSVVGGVIHPFEWTLAVQAQMNVNQERGNHRCQHRPWPQSDSTVHPHA
ncbi:putative transcriptional regulator [Mesorhizobium jarvisii]